MHPDNCSPAQPASPGAARRVCLSPYINEPLPNWEELLSAHDVARLTRRPRWVVLSLSLLGRFPPKHRYHGRSIGWLRSDVVTWLARDLRVLRCCHTLPAGNARSHSALQRVLPLGFARHTYTARMDLRNCMNLRNRSRRHRVRRSRAPDLRES
jgi:predicted DNA-binding transcriptional regulator AlpA